MPATTPARSALVVALVLLGSGCSGDMDRPDHREARDPRGGLDPAAVAATLRTLDLGAPTTGSGYAATLARTAGRLRLAQLSWRYAGPAGAADVLADVTYRLPEDRRPVTTRVTVELGVGPTETPTVTPTVTGVTGAGQRWPTWLAGPVTVRRTPDVVVVAAGSDRVARRQARAYAGLAGRALAVVRRVLPARRPLVVEVPASPAALTSALAGQPGEYDGVAAVTTTADAAVDARAPVRVVLDRQGLAPLGPRARRLVLAHEITHAETGAATARMPLWLLEGFADQVALRDVRLPVRRLAGRAVAAVRADGVPRRLPGPRAFAGPAADAAYEQAWLACRVLVGRGGEDRLVRLYRRVRDGEGTDRALREIFGLSQRALVGVWQDRLARWTT